MREEPKDQETTQIIDHKLIIPESAMESMKLRPDDYIEIFSYSGIGSMEFSGLSFVDDDNSLSIPDEILTTIENRKDARFIIGKEMLIVRIDAPEEEEEGMSTRVRQSMRGTLTTKKPPIEMRLYKHICEVIRYGVAHDYVSQGNTCPLCGEILKGRENVPAGKPVAPICIRCGKEVTGNFCGNCGLRLLRKEKGRVCSTCGNKLEYVDKYRRFYCSKCKMYEKAKKPGIMTATCPDCKKPLSYVKKHDHWFCFNCKGYRIPFEQIPEDRKKQCPVCNNHMTYVEKYDRYYCRNCKKYTDEDDEADEESAQDSDEEDQEKSVSEPKKDMQIKKEFKKKIKK